MILFRPVGSKELELIAASSYTAFPPCLPEQPIFYPVLNFEYAELITQRWNAATLPYIGYVTRFEVEDAYAEKFEVHTIGGQVHKELWVPAEELEEFNRHILGKIEVLATYYGEEHEGNDHIYAYKHSSFHRAEILSSEICGCFYCLKTYNPLEIKYWTDERAGTGQTAICPECGIDSVIGSNSGYPINEDFLKKMHEYWFKLPGSIEITLSNTAYSIGTNMGNLLKNTGKQLKTPFLVLLPGIIILIIQYIWKMAYVWDGFPGLYWLFVFLDRFYFPLIGISAVAGIIFFILHARSKPPNNKRSFLHISLSSLFLSATIFCTFPMMFAQNTVHIQSVRAEGKMYHMGAYPMFDINFYVVECDPLGILCQTIYRSGDITNISWGYSKLNYVESKRVLELHVPEKGIIFSYHVPKQ